MIRRRRATGAALAATAAIVVGTFGVASATTPPDSGAAAGSAPAAADPCASTTATTEPAATEAPATTAAAGTAAPAATAAPTTEPAPVATEAPAPTEARETVPPNVTELDSTSAIDINAQPRDALQQGGEFRLDVGRFADNWNPFNPLGNEPTSPRSCSRCAYFGRGLRRRRHRHPRPELRARVEHERGHVGRAVHGDLQAQPGGRVAQRRPDRRRRLHRQLERAQRRRPPRLPDRRDRGLRPDHVGRAGRRRVRGRRHVRRRVPGLPGAVQPGGCRPSRCSPTRTSTAGPSSTTTGSPVRSSSTRSTPRRASSPRCRTPTGGARAAARQDHLPVVSPDAVPTALANSELDSFDIGPRPQRLPVANTTPGGTVRAAAGPNWRHITFNTHRWPDPRPGDPPGDRALARPRRHRVVRPGRHPVAGEAAEQPHLRGEPGRLRRQRR